MDTLSDQELAAHVRVNFPVTPSNGIHAVSMSVEHFFKISKVIMLLNNKKEDEIRDLVSTVLIVGAAIDRIEELSQDPSVKMPQERSRRLREVVNTLVRLMKEHGWEKETDPVLTVCHMLLINKHITRDQAFRIARYLLGPNAPASANSWRVRVDTYAKNRDLDAIGQPIRRKRSVGATKS